MEPAQEAKNRAIWSREGVSNRIQDDLIYEYDNGPGIAFTSSIQGPDIEKVRAYLRQVVGMFDMDPDFVTSLRAREFSLNGDAVIHTKTRRPAVAWINDIGRKLMPRYFGYGRERRKQLGVRP
jgi:hypothetical protein